MLTDVLYAFAVVVALGLIFGILLALIVRFFGIEEDETAKKIREIWDSYELRLRYLIFYRNLRLSSVLTYDQTWSSVTTKLCHH